MCTFPQRLGLTLGTFAALAHAVWALFIAIGLAQPLMVGIMRMHFIEENRNVSDFFLGDAIVFIFVSFVIAYGFGWVLGTIWERVNKMK